MKKVLTVILASIMMFSLMSIGVSAAGDTMATATKVTFGTKYTGTINSSNTRDYYKIVLSESGALTINTTVFEDMYYALYNEDGGTLVADALSTAYTAGGLKNETFTTHLTAGTYYFDHHRWGADGDYQVKFTFESANETIKEVNGGINEKLTHASDISLNKKYYAQLALNETQDFYSFVVNEKTNVKFTVRTESFIYSAVFNEDGQALKHSGGVRHDVNGGYHEMELELAAGTYYYNVSKWNASCGNYNFTISATGTTVPDEPSTPDNPTTPDEPENPGDSGSSTGDSFIVTILVGIWEFFVNIFTFLFGWIIDLL